MAPRRYNRVPFPRRRRALTGASSVVRRQTLLFSARLARPAAKAGTALGAVFSSGVLRALSPCRAAGRAGWRCDLVGHCGSLPRGPIACTCRSWLRFFFWIFRALSSYRAAGRAGCRGDLGGHCGSLPRGPSRVPVTVAQPRAGAATLSCGIPHIVALPATGAGAATVCCSRLLLVFLSPSLSARLPGRMRGH